MITVRSWLGLAVCALAMGCSHRVGRTERVAYRCSEPAPSSAQEIHFSARVVELKRNSLHVDFDGFGADFSSVEIRFTSPPEWSGARASIYYQGDAVLNGVTLDSGMSIGFAVSPPPCLDQPWLYLSELQGSSTAAGARGESDKTP